MFRFVVVGAIAAAVVLGVPVGAEAATHYSESGAKCTKVGTSGNDTLRGTSKKDVICGLGGNDKIVGLGGDDILDGGSGNDSIYGSAGNDRLYGGSGNDRLYGETGSDRIRGGGGADNLYGSSGDDDLDGGEGADRLDGGAGINDCGGSYEDSFKRCRADRSAPKFLSASASPKKLDVSSGKAVTARIYVRLTDDTGISYVSFGGGEYGEYEEIGPDVFEWSNSRLISGSHRDGVWEVEMTARKWNTNGKIDIPITFSDRSGRFGTAVLQDIVTVVGAVPDVAAPLVSAITLDKDAVDVTAAGAEVQLTAKIADAYSGVYETYACLAQPTESGPWAVEACDMMYRTSGNSKSGTYATTLPIEKGSLGGKWTVVISVADRAGATTSYLSSDALESFEGQPWPRTALPAGVGVLHVTGSVDTTPPSIDEVVLDRTHIADEEFPYLALRVHATDATGEGVRYLNIDIAGAPEGWEYWGMEMSSLESGTATDGWWKVYLPMPAELGIGDQYTITSVSAYDRFHTREFTLPGNTPDAGAVLLAADHVTSGGNPWGGVVTAS